MLNQLIKKARLHRLRNPRIWGLGPVIAVVVLALALWAGFQLEEARKSRRQERAAERFTATVRTQIQDVEDLYQRPIHDLRFARRQVARQLAAVVGELGLNRDARRHPQARWSVGRLYSAVRQDRTAAHFFDQLWRSGDRSPELARSRAVAHGRQLARRLISPRLTEPLGQSWSESWTALEQSLDVMAAGDEPSQRLLAWLRAPKDAESDESVQVLEPWMSRVPEIGPQLEAVGVDPAWLLGSLHLIQARALVARHPETAWTPEAIESARPSWTAAIEAFNEAQGRRPSDSDVFLGLCSAWLDVLRADLGSPDEAPPTQPSRTPLSRAPLSRAPLSRQAEVSCQDGLRTAPESIPLLLGRSKVDLLHARWRLEQQLDPSPWILDSRRSTEQVLALEPDQSDALADQQEATALEEQYGSLGAEG